MPKKTDEEKFPLRDDPEHEHIWDKWYPYSKNQKYRTCRHPKCCKTEIKEVK